MNKDVCSCQFFQNKACEYFPCHAGVPEEEFNCLFCFCPLFALGKACGGHFCYTRSGQKSCENCTFPHAKDSFEKITARYPEIMRRIRAFDEEEKP